MPTRDWRSLLAWHSAQEPTQENNEDVLWKQKMEKHGTTSKHLISNKCVLNHWKVFNAGDPCAQQGIQSIEWNVQSISLWFKGDFWPCLNSTFHSLENQLIQLKASTRRKQSEWIRLPTSWTNCVETSSHDSRSAFSNLSNRPIVSHFSITTPHISGSSWKSATHDACEGLGAGYSPSQLDPVLCECFGPRGLQFLVPNHAFAVQQQFEAVPMPLEDP